ncbi:MAG: lytic transglycosylase domain-containing protein [Nitrospira sp.]|nr:lytic transglycosylase domain-containing protein [Nitrospira sp.]
MNDSLGTTSSVNTLSTGIKSAGNYRSPLPRILSMLTLLCLLTAAAPTPIRPDHDSAHRRYTKQVINRAITWYAKKYRLDPALLRAVIKTESDFRQHVVSDKGAVGLMQLMPATASSLRVSDAYDSLQNIRGGAKQLRHLLNLYEGDLPLTLAAYNAGVHRIKERKIPRIRETRAYVKTVLRYYKSFQARAAHSSKQKKSQR